MYFNRWCNSCGKPVYWDKINNKWILFNKDGTNHFKSCKPDQEYIKRREMILKVKHRAEPLQVGEDEFI